MSPRRLLAVVLGLSAARLAIAPAFELFPQEAYYDLYARHPALSYFDHPPAIAWYLRLFIALLGNHAWVLRLCAFCLTAITQVLFWQLVRAAVPAERRSAALLLLVTPMLSVVSLIASPDVPLLLFSAAALLCFWTAFQGPHARRPWAWLGAGLATGLAFDSKYSGAFLGLGAVLLLLDPLHRRQLREPWPYLGGLIAAAATAPVWIWNAQHGFASLLFQTSGRAQAATGFHLGGLGALIGTQSVLLGILFPVFLWQGARLALRLRELRENPAVLFLTGFSVPPALLFIGLSLFAQVKPNWLYPFYLAGIPLVALLVAKPIRLVAPTLALCLAIQGLAGVELLTAAVPIRSDDTCFGWRELAQAVPPLRPHDGFIFSADDYKTSAELELYSGQKIYAGNILGRRGLEYDYLGDDLAALRGKDALFVDSDPRHLDEARAPVPPPELSAHFASVEQLDPLLIRAHGRVVRKFFLWVCRGYVGPVALTPLGAFPSRPPAGTGT